MAEKTYEHVVLALTSGATPVLVSGVDRYGLNLPGLTFRHPALKGSSLTQAHLSHADLRQADGGRANLTRANLQQGKDVSPVAQKGSLNACRERNLSGPSSLNVDKSLTPGDELPAPQRPLTQCRSLRATAPGQGHWIAFMACLVLLFLPSVALPAPGILAATMEGISDSDTVMTLTAKGVGLLPLLGVHAQAIAYGADPGKLPKKGAREFFQEFLDLLLKVLVSVNVVVTILAAVRLRLDQRAAARRGKDLRICPRCYNLVRRRNATRCPYCRVALAPESHIVTSPPRPELDRYEPARQEPLRRTQPLQPVHEEPIHEARRKTPEFAGPIREEPVRQEPAPKERVLQEPIRDEPLRDGTQGREGEEWEEEEWGPDEWEREEQARRRKELTYAFIFASVVGWVAAALVVLLRLV